jgi:putative membrane protein
MAEQKHILRGAVAGAAAGLFAGWLMNQFQAGPGQALARAVETPADQAELKRESAASDGEDATMKAADALSVVLTGGQHLTWEQRQKDGPRMHYAFSALMGGVYGAMAEALPVTRAGMGTTFGSALFIGGDIFAVPIFRLGPKLGEYPASSLATPYAAHLLYGFTTEMLRRVLRPLL